MNKKVKKKWSLSTFIIDRQTYRQSFRLKAIVVWTFFYKKTEFYPASIFLVFWYPY
jgi:hypothetical protein